MKPALAPALLVLALGGCAMPGVPEPLPLAGEALVKKVDRLSYQDPPAPNLYRIEFDAERSRAIRTRASIEAIDRVEPYHALMQYLEVAAEQELRKRGLCNGTAKLATAVDGIDGNGPMRAIFACRPPLF